MTPEWTERFQNMCDGSRLSTMDIANAIGASTDMVMLWYRGDCLPCRSRGADVTYRLFNYVESLA